MVDRDRAGKILVEMVTTLRVFRVLGQRQREKSISGTKIGVLQHLKFADARLGELARQLSVSASVASRSVDALELDGYVVRRCDDDDARAFVISITDRGRDNLAVRERYIAEKFAEVLSDWTPEETDQALNILQKLNSRLDDLTAALVADNRREPNL